jgi:hypothetical protein
MANPMTLAEWLELGQQLGYCSESVCNTHDGLPMTDQENQLWEDGEDPCVPAVRLWTNNETKDQQCLSTSATQ